ncbi:unnamed protein product [Rhizophagus irregularis]|nr:unnamed protein product [Rhizophagus irregularis]
MSSGRKFKLPKLPKIPKILKKKKTLGAEMSTDQVEMLTDQVEMSIDQVEMSIDRIFIPFLLNSNFLYTSEVFDLEKKFASLKKSFDLEEWKKFYDFAGSDFVWPQPPDINERRLIFDYVIDPYWEPIGSELAVNALEYRRLLDSSSLDQSREYVLIVHGKFVRYGSSEEEKKMRMNYPGCYYVPVKERIVELRRFSASDANTNVGAEKEWQVRTIYNLWIIRSLTGATTTIIPDFVRKKLSTRDGWNVSASKAGGYGAGARIFKASKTGKFA